MWNEDRVLFFLIMYSVLCFGALLLSLAQHSF